MTKFLILKRTAFYATKYVMRCFLAGRLFSINAISNKGPSNFSRFDKYFVVKL